MEITEVKVFPVREEKLKAFVSIIIDDCFMVNDIKIIQGRETRFISMPNLTKYSKIIRQYSTNMRQDQGLPMGTKL